jgi:hypothetical protein
MDGRRLAIAWYGLTAERAICPVCREPLEFMTETWFGRTLQHCRCQQDWVLLVPERRSKHTVMRGRR